MREMLTCFLTRVASRVALPLVQSAPPWHPNHQGKLIKWRPKPCLDVAEGGCVVFAAGPQRIVARQSAKSTVWGKVVRMKMLPSWRLWGRWLAQSTRCKVGLVYCAWYILWWFTVHGVCTYLSRGNLQSIGYVGAVWVHLWGECGADQLLTAASHCEVQASFHLAASHPPPHHLYTGPLQHPPPSPSSLPLPW